MINFRKLFRFGRPAPVKATQAPDGDPKIVLSDRALAQMMFYLSMVKSEFGFAMEGRRLGHTVYVDGIFVPHQVGSSAYWEQTYPDGLDDVYLHFKNTPGVAQVGWGHSHCSFGAFHSSVDINTTKANGEMLKIPSVSLTISRNTRMFDGLMCVEDGGQTKIVDAQVVLPFNPETDKISDGSDIEAHEF
ncbi:MAG: hypothetical protein JRM72_01360 [Nitrososphaerota archaeon]|nr:hypothetical protein [Nitrososphaerota archaeon]